MQRLRQTIPFPIEASLQPKRCNRHLEGGVQPQRLRVSLPRDHHRPPVFHGFDSLPSYTLPEPCAPARNLDPIALRLQRCDALQLAWQAACRSGGKAIPASLRGAHGPGQRPALTRPPLCRSFPQPNSYPSILRDAFGTPGLGGKTHTRPGCASSALAAVPFLPGLTSPEEPLLCRLPFHPGG